MRRVIAFLGNFVTLSEFPVESGLCCVLAVFPCQHPCLRSIVIAVYVMRCGWQADGRTALMLASENGHTAVVQALIGAEAKVNNGSFVSVTRDCFCAC
jgi:hypothetical protein